MKEQTKTVKKRIQQKMKKNILKVTLVTAFALVAGYNMYTSQKSDMEMSDLALTNVEALAQHWESESPKTGYESSSYQIYLPPIPGLTSGGYTKTSGKCSDPVSYKTWVSCKSGGTEDCNPSDC